MILALFRTQDVKSLYKSFLSSFLSKFKSTPVFLMIKAKWEGAGGLRVETSLGPIVHFAPLGHLVALAMQGSLQV